MSADDQHPGHQLLLQEVKKKIMTYCAYQERSELEVREKLKKMGLTENEVEDLTHFLQTEGFQSNERFAELFAGGKFRLNQWGRLKIKMALVQKGIEEGLIHQALNSIDQQEYRATLSKLITKKINTLKGGSLPIKRQKVAHFLLNKGYESHEVWAMIDRHFEDHE